MALARTFAAAAALVLTMASQPSLATPLDSLAAPPRHAGIKTDGGQVAGLFGNNYWGDCFSNLLADVYQDDPTRRVNSSVVSRVLVAPFLMVGCMAPAK